ncbi:hypothetical protein [Pantoea agglomerans]|nr:hypothetical protein [Pantoea agglomerans]
MHITEYEAWQRAFEGGELSLIEPARRYAHRLVIIANGNLHES